MPPQGDLTLEHKIDRMATVRVPRCPHAGRKVHHELYHLGLQGSIRDAEPRLGDNPASPSIAGIETGLAENGNSRGRGHQGCDGQNPPPR